MNNGRRKFLKVAGASMVLLGGKPVISAVTGKDLPKAEASKKSVRGKTAYAMVIDTRECLKHDDCHDCELACHTAHNVPNFGGNKKEEVKWIWKSKFESVFPDQQHDFIFGNIKNKPFLALCNHCDNPPCVRVCPTQATFKRKDGIVTMDMHRCIGCRFCMAACPYGSRSFNWRNPKPLIKEINEDYPTRMRGVVEKCNFCAELIGTNKKPYCVEACKHKALTFGNIQDPNDPVRKLLASGHAIRRKPSLGTGPEVYYLI